MTDVVNPFGEATSTPVVQLPTNTGIVGKKHHWLFSGEVMVMEAEDLGSIKLNCMLVTDAERITAYDLARAQTALQRHFFERRNMDREGINIVDVFIVGFSYCGLMKPTLFTAMPEGFATENKG